MYSSTRGRATCSIFYPWSIFINDLLSVYNYLAQILIKYMVEGVSYVKGYKKWIFLRHSHLSQQIVRVMTILVDVYLINFLFAMFKIIGIAN